MDLRFILDNLKTSKATTEEIYIAKGGYVVETTLGGFVRQVKNLWHYKKK